MGKSRPKRWAEACAAAEKAIGDMEAARQEFQAALEDLNALREEYEEWKDNLPENLEQSPVAEKLEAIVELDFESKGDEIETAISEAADIIGEADAIDRKLRRIEFPRPLTHDLFQSVLEATETRITSVLVDQLRPLSGRAAGGTYFAVLTLQQPGKDPIQIDSRPSDAIALAVRLEFPVYVSRKILDENAIFERDGQPDAPRQGPSGEPPRNYYGGLSCVSESSRPRRRQAGGACFVTVPARNSRTACTINGRRKDLCVLTAALPAPRPP